MKTNALLATLLLPMTVTSIGRRPADPDFTIVATDYAYTVPASVTAGQATIAFKNNGKEIHHAQLAKLNNGVTWQQFQETLNKAVADSKTKGDAAFLQLFTLGSLAGGVASISPGQTATATVNLPAGNYVVLCFVPGQDGVSHVAKGMVAHFTAKGTGGATAAAPPAHVDGTVQMMDFAYSNFPDLKPGPVTLEVVNNGKEPHELGIMKATGVSAQQLVQILTTPPSPGSAPHAGPPPFEAVGGIQGLMPGQKGWATLNLTPGDYVAICMIPSAANGGKPHSVLGMTRTFTVK